MNIDTHSFTSKTSNEKIEAGSLSGCEKIIIIIIILVFVEKIREINMHGIKFQRKCIFPCHSRTHLKLNRTRGKWLFWIKFKTWIGTHLLLEIFLPFCREFVKVSCIVASIEAFIVRGFITRALLSSWDVLIIFLSGSDGYAGKWKKKPRN